MIAGVIVPIREAIAARQRAREAARRLHAHRVRLVAIWMGVLAAQDPRRGARQEHGHLRALRVHRALLDGVRAGGQRAQHLGRRSHRSCTSPASSIPAEYWQFVNPLLIVLFAPLFSILWVALAAKGLEPSTPAKMFVAMVLMALSFGAMVAAGQAENQGTTRVALAALPEGVSLDKLDAGRLRYDAASHELEVRGVLPPFVVTEALEAVAPPPTRPSSRSCPTPTPRPRRSSCIA